MLSAEAVTDYPPSRRPSLDLWLLPAAVLLFHVVTAPGYGYFRDELYYMVNGEHLGFGYVEHPPLIGWVAAAVRATLGDSLYAIRFPPALAAALTVLLAGLTARDLGGRRFARLLAMLAVFLTPVHLSLFAILSMNAFDLLWWSLGGWLLVRLLGGADRRLWLAFGAVAGLGLLTKLSFLFFGLGVVAGLLLARRWDVFRAPWFYAGGALAALLFLPHVLWQVTHGWPTLEFMDNARRFKNVELGPLAFLGEQLLITAPAGVLVALPGVAWLLTVRAARPVRALGWVLPAVLAAMLLLGGAKPYYLAPAYLLPFAAGGRAWETWTAELRWGRAARGAVVAVVLLVSAALAPLAKPLLPVDVFVAYSRRLGVAPGSGERHEQGRLPQFYADMHGWPELAATVAQVYRTLPEEDRRRACVFAQNYGEAGAIDVLGRRHDLPPAISGHNSYYLWGPGECTGEVVLVIGDEGERLEELFAEVELGAVFDCTDCMPYEDGRPVWVCRGLEMPVEELWPQVKNYN